MLSAAWQDTRETTSFTRYFSICSRLAVTPSVKSAYCISCFILVTYFSCCFSSSPHVYPCLPDYPLSLSSPVPDIVFISLFSQLLCQIVFVLCSVIELILQKGALNRDITNCNSVVKWEERFRWILHYDHQLVSNFVRLMFGTCSTVSFVFFGQCESGVNQDSRIVGWKIRWKLLITSVKPKWAVVSSLQSDHFNTVALVSHCHKFLL